MTRFQITQEKCPRCERAHSFQVSDALPRQVFDVRCCGGQTVETRMIGKRGNATFRAWEWTQTMWDRRRVGKA